MDIPSRYALVLADLEKAGLPVVVIESRDGQFITVRTRKSGVHVFTVARDVALAAGLITSRSRSPNRNE